MVRHRPGRSAPQAPRATPITRKHCVKDIAMTQTLRDPNDTGEIARPIDAQTVRLAVGEQTEKLFLDAPIRAIEDTMILDIRPAVPADADIDVPLTHLLDTVGYPPVPKPTPPKPKHATWTGQVGEFPTVRPAVPPRAGRGRHRRTYPLRVGMALGAGGLLLLALAAVGVSALLGVQW